MSDYRLWIRGAIVPAPDGVALRTASPAKNLPGIEEFAYADPLLEAISVERSGFRGMRCLIHDSLVTAGIRNRFVFAVRKKPFFPFKKLENSFYPDRVAKDYQDFLWMADGATSWNTLEGQMVKRLKWSARGPEEFVHAAATQVVFHETESILRSIK